jgi:hypothetical protein
LRRMHNLLMMQPIWQGMAALDKRYSTHFGRVT